MTVRTIDVMVDDIRDGFCERCDYWDDDEAESRGGACDLCEVTPSNFVERVDPVATLEAELKAAIERAENWRRIAMQYELRLKVHDWKVDCLTDDTVRVTCRKCGYWAEGNSYLDAISNASDEGSRCL